MHILYLTLSALLFASISTDAMKRSNESLQINDTQNYLLMLPDDMLTIIIANCESDTKYMLLSTNKQMQKIVLKNSGDAEKTYYLTRCIHEDYVGLLKALFIHGIDLNQTTQECTSLYLAISKNSTQCAKFLIEKTDIDINASSDAACHPLYVAAQEGHAEIMKCLLRHGTIDTKKTFNGFTALHITAQRGHLAIVKLLLAHDPDLLNMPCINGSTPLYIAAQKGCTDVIEFLLTFQNIDVNAGYKRNTPLHTASCHGQVGVVQLLIHDKRTSLNALDEDGNTPLHLACINQFPDIVNILRTFDQLDANVVNNSGETPFDIAVEHKHKEIIRSLVAAGAIH